MVRSVLRCSLAVASVFASFAACSPAASRNSAAIDGSTDPSEAGPGGSDGGDEGIHIDAPIATGESGPGTGGCHAVDDCDGDGFKAGAGGDCNDNDGTINPHAYDFPGDGVDDDCDGTKDNPVDSCTPSTSSKAPVDFARSADLCPQRSLDPKTGKPYDFLGKAEWGSLPGSPPKSAAVGVVSQLGGTKSRFGGSMFGLQTGTWADNDPRSGTATNLDGALFGPSVADGCAAIPLLGTDCKSLTNGTGTGGGVGVCDYSELRLTVHVPSNANAMLFDFAFFSTEFNEYWNTTFNDAFYVIVNGKYVKGANVSKDSTGNAITVNSGFFQLCPTAGSVSVQKPEALVNCVGVDGNASKSIFGRLTGTNFDGASASPPAVNDTTAGSGSSFVYGGGSGWLTTKFQVEPGEDIVLRFMIMDASDCALDSAALVDHIRWEKAPPAISTGTTERPPS